MSQKQTAIMMRDLDVARSIFYVLEHVLENNVGIDDNHCLSVLAGAGKRSLDGVVNMLADHL